MGVNCVRCRTSAGYLCSQHVELPQQTADSLGDLLQVDKRAQKRALYDCLGKDGISPDMMAVIPRTKTPKEIRDEYERLTKEREERELLRRTNPTSRVTMRFVICIST